ncbi:hypothetical protein BGZ46_007915 [Entomortierella lignicola]|nr:hypothetical protein BGZ46_007915 [Entomortierella lignicola]
METALGLPEIIACIGKYLSRSGILNCIRVQKSWKAELEPLLWRTFTCRPYNDDYGVPSEKPRPSLVLMQQNAQNIRRLFIEEMDPAYHIAFFCQCIQLEELTFTPEKSLFRSPQAEQVQWQRLADMIQNHPRLRKFVIKANPYGTLTPSASFLNTLQKCPKLVVFETTDCQFDLESTQAYLRANSTNMRRLSTCRDGFSSAFDFSSCDIVFPEMRYLDLRATDGMSIGTQLQLVTRCPKLISLYWEGIQILPVKKFTELIPKSCPNLTALHLILPLCDFEIGPILDAVPRIEKLSLTKTEFGQIAFKALRRHFPTLKDVNLQLSPGANSAMIQEILSSCPNLQSISGEVLLYADMIKQPWVCQNLQMFDVGIRVLEVDGRGHFKKAGLKAHIAVYERLSQFSKLDYLSVCNNDIQSEGSLLLSLKAGFGLLRTLKNLTFFSCKTLLLHACLLGEAVEVVEWILDHWKRLESLEGILSDHEEEDTAGEIIATLEAHGVQFVDFQLVLEEMDGDYVYDEEEDEDDFDEDQYLSEDYAYYDGEYEFDDDQDEFLADLLYSIDM